MSMIVSSPRGRDSGTSYPGGTPVTGDGLQYWYNLNNQSSTFSGLNSMYNVDSSSMNQYQQSYSYANTNNQMQLQVAGAASLASSGPPNLSMIDLRSASPATRSLPFAQNQMSLNVVQAQQT